MICRRRFHYPNMVYWTMRRTTWGGNSAHGMKCNPPVVPPCGRCDVHTLCEGFRKCSSLITQTRYPGTWQYTRERFTWMGAFPACILITPLGTCNPLPRGTAKKQGALPNGRNARTASAGMAMQHRQLPFRPRVVPSHSHICSSTVNRAGEVCRTPLEIRDHSWYERGSCYSPSSRAGQSLTYGIWPCIQDHCRSHSKSNRSTSDWSPPSEAGRVNQVPY